VTQHKTRVLAAITDHGCATSRDVCDVTGLSRQFATEYLVRFWRAGVLTRRKVPRDVPGRMEYFYEVAR
jgi:DNA-binding MarR family transcriptional regulator